MRRAKELGCEFGNHSLTHQEMAAFNAEKIKEEINTTTQLIQNAVGNTPVFFRAPFASVSATMYSTIEMPFIRGVIANDWDENYDVNYRSDTILRQTVDGTIICMHDFEGNRMTVEALDTIIPSLKDKGFQLVTISQLFERKGVTPKTRSGYYDNV